MKPKVYLPSLLPNWHLVGVFFHIGQESQDRFWIINCWLSATMVCIQPQVYHCVSIHFLNLFQELHENKPCFCHWVDTLLDLQPYVVSYSKCLHWCWMYFSGLLQSWSGDYVWEIKASYVLCFSQLLLNNIIYPLIMYSVPITVPYYKWDFLFVCFDTLWGLSGQDVCVPDGG